MAPAPAPTAEPPATPAAPVSALPAEQTECPLDREDRSSELADDADSDEPRKREQRGDSPRGQLERASLGGAGGAVPEMGGRPPRLLIGRRTGGERDQIGLEASAPLADLVFGDQRPEPAPSPLRHLAELLIRPAEPPAELRAIHPETDLAGEDQALVVG